MSNSYFSNFPRQKLTKSQKGPKWYKECIDAVEESGFFDDEGVRQSFKEKVICTNLYNGHVDIKDIEKTLNPEELSDDTIPTSIQHYPIMNPRIDVLVGEEAKRRFDYKAIVTNPDAVNMKQKEMGNVIHQKVVELIQSQKSRQEVEKELVELDRYLKYQWKDLREIRANRILNHLFHELKLERVFNHGFKDVLIRGEEYYQADIVAGEPVFHKLDPMKVFYVRSGFSNKIEHSDLIILDDMWSPGQIIDYFHDDLKPGDIAKLEKHFTGGTSKDPFVDEDNKKKLHAVLVDDEDSINDLIELGRSSGFKISNAYDVSGNIRVLRVYWRGWRKVQKVTYFDDFGDEQVDIFPEDYKVREELGESSKTLWINEWYEGTKVGEDLYLRMRPKPVQYLDLENPSRCHPGITGRTYSLDSTGTVSLMSKSKNYQYLYDVIHDRLNKLLAANQGKILEMDFASVPNEWSIDQWIHYFKKMKIAVKDSFKEANKGAATGKIYGGINTASKGYIDLDNSQAIQQYVGLLEFIKLEMSEITGVSDQRLGQIENRETVGGVERSVTQSSHITEWYFAEHDDVKLEALRILLETAKIAYKGKNKKVQHILDDHSIALFELDGDQFAEHDYGIVITSSTKTQEIEQHLKRLAEMALSAGAIGFDSVMDIYMSTSLSDIKHKIAHAEQQKREAEQAQLQAQQEQLAAQLQATAQLEQEKLAMEDIKNQRDNETRIIVESMKQSGESAPEDNSIDYEKLNLDRQKRLDDLNKFNKELSQRKLEHQDKVMLEKKKIAKQSSNAKK